MTASSVSSTISGSHGLLTGDLIDLLIEAVVLPTDPVARSAVICELLNEVCDAVDWLHGAAAVLDDSVAQETASLRQLVVAAQDHRQRMRALGTNGVGHGGGR
jgi:hypothetical protein